MSYRSVALALTLLSASPPCLVEAQETPARERALELYRQSRAEYDIGDYRAAADLLERAYEIFPEPNLLYNLARAYGSLGEHARAVAAYEAYLEASPEAEDRAIIEARIANSREILAQETRAREQAEAERQAALERTRIEALEQIPPPAPQPTPWVLAGVGAGALVAAAVFGAVSLSERDTANGEPSAIAAAAASDRAVAFAWVANGGFAVGGVVALVGVIWGIVDVASLETPSASALRLDAQGVRVSW